MKKINSSLVYYNANTRDASVGDCVKRSLSVAYSLDYDEVSKELNQIKRALNLSVFNDKRVFNVFMSRRGDKFSKVSEGQTLEDFANAHPSGVYLLLVGKNKNNDISTHMVAVISGDVYDSWNSLDYYVKNVASVSSGKSDTYELDGYKILTELISDLTDYVMNLNKKCPDAISFSMLQDYERDNKYTYRIYLRCQTKQLPKYCEYRSNISYGHQIVVKLNPRLDEDANLNTLYKKCKQKIYDYVYNIKKDVEDSIKAESIEVNKTFYGSKKDLMKLPEWCRSYIEGFYESSNLESNKFEVYMKSLPGDPRKREVIFYADTLSELKDQLAMYKEKFCKNQL